MLISTAWTAGCFAILASLSALAYGILQQRRVEAETANRSFAGLGESLLKIKPKRALNRRSNVMAKGGTMRKRNERMKKLVAKAGKANNARQKSG